MLATRGRAETVRHLRFGSYLVLGRSRQGSNNKPDNDGGNESESGISEYRPGKSSPDSLVSDIAAILIVAAT
jgi:hypothetical protein